MKVTCSLVTKMGILIYLSFSFVFIIHVVGADNTTAPKNVTYTVGRNITLDCFDLEPGDRVDNLSWKKNGVILASIGDAGEKQNDIPGATMTDLGQLVFSGLNMDASGEYKCIMYYRRRESISLENAGARYNLLVQDKPGPPGKPQPVAIQSRNVTMTWAPSSEINNSPVIKHILIIRECESLGINQIGQEDVPVKDVGGDGTDAAPLSHVVNDLSPYTCYSITVTAMNSVGKSLPSRPSDEFYTEQESPSAPVKLRVTEVKSTQLQLEWDPVPEDKLNGELLGYEINCESHDGDLTNVTVGPDKKKKVIEGLMPYTLYDVKIRAQNSAGSGPWIATSLRTKPGIPSKPRITHLSDRQPTSFVVHWEPPKVTNGPLLGYELKWKLKEDSKTMVLSGHLINPMSAKIDNLIPYSAYKVQVVAVTIAGLGEYSDIFPALTDVAAPGPPMNLNMTEKGITSVKLHWERPTLVYKVIDKYHIKGWNNHGEVVNKDVNGQLTEYILSGLRKNSRYHVKVCASTNAIFSKSRFKGDYTSVINFTLGEPYSRSHDDSGMHPGVIVAIVCLLSLVLVVAVLCVGYRFYTCRKCYQDTYRYFVVPSNGMPIQQPIIAVEEISEEKQYSDIDVSDFLLHVEHMHSDSDIGFSQEFDEINRSSHSDKYTYDNSNVADNRNKNRYINIVAYDHSRVVLKTELGRLRQTDYINANYVDGYTKPKAYIATQGPLPQTFPDFWRMVWEQNSNVIVMITNLMEKGRRKCDQYWPNDGQESYGSMQVKLITTVPRAHYTVRIFSLRNMKVKKRHSMKGSAERTVYHYHYTEWPDHGVPDYALPVLSFVQKSAAQSGPENGPIVVHCSAGVGRTGTYILIDSMIAQVEDKQSINIPGFTQHIRRQRNFLVQTEDQYIFIHEVLKEYLLADGVTEVKEDHMVGYLRRLEQPSKSMILTSFTEASILERQFQLLTEYAPNEMDLSAALKPVNQEKNRVGSILPVNMKRVLLPARPGVDGSDYINATFLQGYKKSSEFIVTQHPTEDTMEDFWRMVWDKNSPVIVVLSAFDDLEYKEFWPPKGSSIEVDSGNFRLVMKDEPSTEDLQEKGISFLEFILDSIQYDYTLLTRIICLREWPSSCTELHTVFDPIIFAHSYISSPECGPIVVLDRYGGVEAGAFCALWTLRDQMLSEKCCDFYEVCKLYHYKRPGIIGNQDNYLFLHNAMATLCARMQEEQASNGSSPRHHQHYHFPSLHLSNSSNTAARQNGTLPRLSSSSPNTSNPSTLAVAPPLNTGTSNADMLPAVKSDIGEEPDEGGSSPAFLPAPATLPVEMANTETNI